jgi:lipooligosaccharide transport system permease protein
MAQTLATTGRSTGRVVGSWRAALLVVEARWIWYRRGWRASVFSTVLVPALFLIALGHGFGALVPPSEATAGRSYLIYLAPALLAAGAVQNALTESTYPVLSHFKWRRTYHAATATPIAPAQVLGGELLWIALRLLVAGAAYLLVALALGALPGPGVLLSLPFAVLTGMAMAAPVIAYAAALDSQGEQFGYVVRFVVIPMTLFAGTFFPVSQLPAWARPVAWATPLWQGTELSRAAAFGTLRLGATLGHVGYLVVLTGIGVALAARRYRRRLGV